MGKAILRGLLCGICAAVYIFIVLVSVYFNLIPEQYALITELIMPIGCAVIVPVFLEKSRISRFFMSALFFAAVLAAGVYLELRFNLTGMLFRVFYGFVPGEIVGNAQLTILFAAVPAVFLGLLIAFIISAVSSARTKKMIDKLEVKK